MEWNKTSTVPPPTYTDLLLCFKDRHPHGGDLVVVGYLDAGDKGSGIWLDPITNYELEIEREPDYWCKITCPIQ